jgi:cytochrome b561
MLRGDRDHWGSVAKAFHWTIVLLILVQGALGLIMVELPKRPATIAYYDVHKSIGLTVLALVVLRLAWRAFDERPLAPDGMPPRQVLAARVGHGLLYVLLFAMPLSGWWVDSASGLRPLRWWGLFEIPHVGAPDKATQALAEQVHEALFWLLVAVATGHALIALAHQFVSRDNVLGRMWPDALQRHP